MTASIINVIFSRILLISMISLFQPSLLLLRGAIFFVCVCVYTVCACYKHRRVRYVIVHALCSLSSPSSVNPPCAIAVSQAQ